MRKISNLKFQILNGRSARQFSQHNRGVGLVEAVVAIGILVTGILSVVTLTQSNIASSQSVEARLIGINLAREGMEAVRSIRDGNWLKGRTGSTGTANAWDTGLSGSGDATAIAVLNSDTLEWALDFIPNNITDSNARMRRSMTRGLYRQSLESPWPAGETATQYFRLITIYSICNNYPGTQETFDTASCSSGWNKSGLRVISRVQWEEKGRTESLEVEAMLYNWRYGFTPYVD